MIRQKKRSSVISGRIVKLTAIILIGKVEKFSTSEFAEFRQRGIIAAVSMTTRVAT